MKIKQTILVLALLVGANCAFIGQPAFAECKTSIINISCNTGSASTDVTSTGIWSLLLLIINIMTAGIGVLAVGGVIYASILYASAGGSSDQVKKAKTIIMNIVIGLVAYALMYSLLNFIIPGGLFS